MIRPYGSILEFVSMVDEAIRELMTRLGSNARHPRASERRLVVYRLAPG